MLKRRILQLGFVMTGTLLAVDFSGCGPAGQLMEVLLPMVVMRGLGT